MYLLEDDFDKGIEIPRTLFYLAQTYECLGDLPKARGLYERRVQTPGWDQETFEAMFRTARCSLGLRKFDEAVIELLAAHRFMPNRAEPLYHLAEFFRQNQQYSTSYMFARRAVQIPPPQVGLFIDGEVYEWKANDVLAVSAYYVAKNTGDDKIFAEGRDAADRALAARPDDARLLRNRAFFG